MKLLRIEAVKEITGLSRSTIYETKGFPKPVKVGVRAVGWVESEVLAYLNAKMREREAA